MKTIAIILCLLASTAWAGEEFTVNSSQMANMTTTQITSMIFSTGFDDEAGTLTWEGGVFKFSGNPDTSAQVLLDWLNQHYNTRAEMYCQPKNAEIIDILERARHYVGGWRLQTMTLEYCDELCQAERHVEQIKAREQLRQDIEDMIKRLK